VVLCLRTLPHNGHGNRSRRLEQHAARRSVPQLVRLEQPDDAVFAVIAGVADDLAGAQPRHGFGKHGRIRPRNILERDGLQNVELGAEG